MYEFDLQMYADNAPRKAVHGKRIVYLFRPLKNSGTSDAVAMAFVTENERSMSKDSDSTATKDGPVVTPSEVENEITATSLLANDDTLMEQLEEAMIKDELIEIWEANLDNPAAPGENKFKGRYMQGYLTEFTQTSSAEDYVEISTTFAINGAGAKGDVTVSAAQQEVAAYVFADTAKTGA